MEVATAFVTIRPETSGFEAELASALGGQSVEVPVGADVEEAQSNIESLDGGDIEVEVGAVTDPAQAEIDGLDGGTVEVEVGANTEDAQSKIDGLAGSLEGVLGSAGGGGGGATGALDAFSGAALGAGSAGSIAATGGLAAVAVGLGFSANAAMEAEVSTALLTNTLAQSGADAYLTADAIGALAMEIQGYSGLSDEAIQDAARMLLSFANVRTEAAVTSGVFDRATRSVADIARFMGSDAVTAAGMLGRALDNPVTGVTALTRARVSFTEAERAAITAMAESGDITGAQNALLQAVEGNVKGAAAAYGDTLAGDVDKAKESIGNAAEQIGNVMIPALGDLATFLGGAAEGFQLLSEDVEDFLSKADSQFIEQSEAWTNMFQALGLSSRGSKGITELGNASRDAAPQVAEFTEAQQAANDAVAATLPTLGGVIGEVDRAGEAFGVLNASSDPQAIIDNLSLALFAWDDFQANIRTINDWGPAIGDALSQLGPEVAGGLADALANADAATIVALDGLVAEVASRKGDITGVLTGFATSGMEGAVAAVGDAAPAMGAAGQQAGAEGAAGIDAGLAFTNASNIGQVVGVQYAAGVSSGISSMAGTVSAVANNLLAGVSISSAYSRGQSLGSSYAAGVVAGLAGGIGNVVATRASVDAAAAEFGAALDRSSAASVAPTGTAIARVYLDGRQIQETVFEHDRRMAMAEGYEPA